jgi:hypothetical protein
MHLIDERVQLLERDAFRKEHLRTLFRDAEPMEP